MVSTHVEGIRFALTVCTYICYTGFNALPLRCRVGGLPLRRVWGSSFGRGGISVLFFFIVYGIVFPVRCTDGVVWQAIAASVGLVAW